MSQPVSIQKQAGVTDAERYLSTLCSRSFLSLWSYPGVYRDAGKCGGGDGKELCDLLVVFGDDIILFSDKDCQFPSTGRLDLDWQRWFRRAVLKSAEQIWGAERWLRLYPSKVFVDRRCTQPFPVPLPDSGRARFHRIVVAHDASRRCRELLGGSGSLVILPALQGDAHVNGPVHLPGSGSDLYESWARLFPPEVGYAKTVLPFAVGDLDPDRTRGFVHVFDDTGLGAVMKELDTAPDFVAYLRDREAYIRSGRLLMAAGEDELLATYLCEVDGQAFRSFIIPDDGVTKVAIPEGEWAILQGDPSWIARKRANEVSYFWDELIERFSECILDSSSVAYPHADFETQELAVRAMAREPRLHRRVHATSLGDFLRNNSGRYIEARVASPVSRGYPYYIFLTVRREAGEDLQQYREKRQAIAYAYLIEGRRTLPDANEVVVFATEPTAWQQSGSEDLLYRGPNPLTENEIESVREFVEELGVLRKLGQPFQAKVREYPQSPTRVVPAAPRRNGRPPSKRNSPCRCGSGKKAKKCCLG